MEDIASLVDSLSGMAQKRQLVARGARDIDLTLAVKRGEVTRVRNGWYSTLSASDRRLRAVRVGGRLTGISLIAQLGGWVLKPPPLHVSVPANAARLRTQSNRRRRLRMDAKAGVALHWDDPELGERGTSMTVALADALLRVVLDEDWETAIAACDWALHFQKIDMIDFEAMIALLPERLRCIRDWVDPTCESLPESLSRTRFRLAGHQVRTQVPVADTGRRGDLLVDEVVGFEVDGEEFHLTTFYSDRDKDIDMTLHGLHALRPSARHVFDGWERVYAAVLVALEARGVERPSPAATKNSGVRRERGARGRRTPHITIPERQQLLNFRNARGQNLSPSGNRPN
jgi:very-short-patch-repair endonuclease